jgi:hypothetical protein
MWELEFVFVEEARAYGHGRDSVRREERLRSDESVIAIGEKGAVARGFCLDRSANGARIVLPVSAGPEVGEQVSVYIGKETLVARVVWVLGEGDACVLGLERCAAASGEFPIVAFGDLEYDEATRAA